MTPIELGLSPVSKWCARAFTGRTLAVFVFGAALAGSPALAQDAKKAAAESGQNTVGEATHVDLSVVPTLSLEAAARILPPPEPRGNVTEEQFESRKAAAARGPAAPAVVAPASPPSGQGVLTPGASFAFRAQSVSGSVAPSDMAVAVSPSFVVQVVNSSIAIYNKSGALQSGFPKLLSTFFPGTTGDVGDPRAFYDWQFGRFVVVVDDFTGGTMHVAASATSDPTGVWHMYTLAPWGAANCRAAGHACADFPQLGFDDDTIFLGVNFFTTTGSISDYMLLLPKASIYAGTGFGFNYWFNLSWGGTNVDTVQPVIPLSQSEHPRAGFAINSFNINFGGGQCTSGCNGLVVWAFSNNLQSSGSPGSEFSAVRINTTTYTFPAQANEPGCPNCIDTNDVRIFGTPSYHAGVISASLNTNGPDHHSHTLWFQVQPTLNDNDPRCTANFTNLCPQITAARILNEDCLFCGGQGTNGSTFFGTLMPNIAGDLTMVFNYSDDNIFPETAYVSRRATQTVNTMHDSGFVLCGGAASYSQGRWGDYTATAGDLTSLTQDFVWFSGMNSIAGGNWGTCIGANGFTSASQP